VPPGAFLASASGVPRPLPLPLLSDAPVSIVLIVAERSSMWPYSSAAMLAIRS
jgi:hypothetical protein